MSAQRAVIISGSSGGIGQALCHGFRDAGYFTVGVDKNPQTQEHTDAFLRVDLSDLVRNESVRSQFFEELEAHLTGMPIAALINNAAVQIAKPTAELTTADWEQTLDINLLAAFILSQGLLNQLSSSGGSIINIGSIHSRLTKPNFVAYATSKAALEGMTRAMAVDLGARVRVNAISPAAIETEMLKAGFSKNPEAFSDLSKCHPAERIGDPQEISELALFLVSDRARFMTGSVIGIDGAIGARLHDPA